MLKDPGETTNLWARGEFQDVKARLMHHLMDWMVVQD
jgi:hypothetical protein